MIRYPFAGVALLLGAAPATPQQPAGPALTLDPPAGLDAYMPIPDDAPLTAASVALGRRLFFDPSLSSDGRVACASCHDPERSFADSLPVSRGVHGTTGRRNTPALINALWNRSFFWDGRATSLEEQVLRPIEDPAEMDARVVDVVARLRKDAAYVAAFEAAYGTPPERGTLARALAAYVRTILSGDAPFDRFRAGAADALSPAAKAGFRLFVGRANCATCHVGPTFSDQRFHNTGVAFRDGVVVDSGRFLVTRRTEDLGAFRTPTLRDVERTAPYMHDGSLATLEDVIDFYAAGGRPSPHLDREIRPLRLGPEEKRALIAYLRALTGTASAHLPVTRHRPGRPAASGGQPQQELRAVGGVVRDLQGAAGPAGEKLAQPDPQTLPTPCRHARREAGAFITYRDAKVAVPDADADADRAVYGIADGVVDEDRDRLAEHGRVDPGGDRSVRHVEDEPLAAVGRLLRERCDLVAQLTAHIDRADAGRGGVLAAPGVRVRGVEHEVDGTQRATQPRIDVAQQRGVVGGGRCERERVARERERRAQIVRHQRVQECIQLPRGVRCDAPLLEQQREWAGCQDGNERENAVRQPDGLGRDRAATEDRGHEERGKRHGVGSVHLARVVSDRAEQDRQGKEDADHDPGRR